MISVVYFAYIPATGDWQDIIYNHINVMKNTGLSKVATIYIHIASQNEVRISECKRYIKANIPNTTISTSTQNQFEYPGIHKVWELAKENPSRKHLILYFHSKGITHQEPLRRHTHVNTILKYTILPWKKVRTLFEQDRTLNKAGFTSSLQGWIWYNFWWARASYLAECEEPVITKVRHYYEQWLSASSNNSTKHASYFDCYSLASNRKAERYDIPGTGALLNMLCRQKTPSQSASSNSIRLRRSFRRSGFRRSIQKST